MKRLAFLILITVTFRAELCSQIVAIEPIAAPDSLIGICDRLFISELGEKMVMHCLNFDTALGIKKTWQDGATRFDYSIRYTFSFPGISNASFPLEMNLSYYSGVRKIQSGRFLRWNQSDLPEDIQSRGMDLLPYETIKQRAVEANEVMQNIEGTLVLGQEYFYWIFSSFRMGGTEGDPEPVIENFVSIDPYSGAVMSKSPVNK